MQCQSSANNCLCLFVPHKRVWVHACVHACMCARMFAGVCQWKKPGRVRGGENVTMRFKKILRIYFIIYWSFKCTFLSLEYWWIIKIDFIDLKNNKDWLYWFEFTDLNHDTFILHDARTEADSSLIPCTTWTDESLFTAASTPNSKLHPPASIDLCTLNSCPPTLRKTSLKDELWNSWPKSSLSRHSGTLTGVQLDWPDTFTVSPTTLTCGETSPLWP